MMDAVDLRAWLGKSRARDEARAPVIGYRIAGGAPVAGALRFLDVDSANAAAGEGTWLEPAYLRIERPFLETPDDSLVDVGSIAQALGEPAASRVVSKFGVAIEATGSFEPYRGSYGSLEHMARAASEEDLAALQLPAEVLLADAEEVAALAGAGFDGAIFGSGEQRQWHVFGEAQVRPAIAAGWPHRPASAAAAPRRPEDGRFTTVSAMREAVRDLIGAAPGADGAGELVVTTSTALQRRLRENDVGQAEALLRASSAASPNLQALMDLQAERRRKAIAAIGDVGDCAVVRKPGEARWMMILRDASTPGNWRTQPFDEDGFSGHMSFADRGQAIDKAAQAGFTERDDLALDRLQDTPRFRRGLLAAELMQEMNAGEISFGEVHRRLQEHDRVAAVLTSISDKQAQAMCDVQTGSIFLLADRIARGHEAAVLFHELMHKHGRTTLGAGGWNRLMGGLRAWRKAPVGTAEHLIYMAADARAQRASRGDYLLYEDELFSYAVEEAVLRGFKPSAQALEGSVERWLDDVESTLRGVLMQLTRSPKEPLSGQQLVDLAYAIAQMENPQRAALIQQRLGGGFERVLEQAESVARQAKRSRQTPAAQKPVRMSNQAVGATFRRLVLEATDDLHGVLMNWNDSELSEDGDRIVTHVGRDGRYSRGADGGSVNVSKREFLEWLASAAPFDSEVYGEEILADAEWRAQIERLRGIGNLGAPAKDQEAAPPVAPRQSLAPVSTGTRKLLRQRGEPVASMMDAQRRFSGGERLFVVHEMEDAPSEARSVLDLDGYTADQIFALPVPDGPKFTDTPAFKAWFGDWQDRTAHSSKYPKDKAPVSLAVNTDGTPRLMFHATNADFSIFETLRPTTNSTTFGPVDTERHAIFVTPEIRFAEEHLGGKDGATVLPVYLDVKAPADLTDGVPGEIIAEIVARTDLRYADFYHLKPTDTWQLFDGEFGEKVVGALKAAGYDGAILLEVSRDRQTEHEVWAAFEPSQVKSAIGNSGEFDRNSADIRHSVAARTRDEHHEHWINVEAELKKKYVIYLRLNPGFTPGELNLYEIECKLQGKGVGSDVLRELVRLADQGGTTMTLRVAAGHTEEELLNWYTEFGFLPNGDGTMRREPGAPVTRPLWKGAAFKEWFGKSAIVRKDTGAPVVGYHGTSADVNEFRPSATGAQGPGIYLTDAPSDYGTKTMELFVRMENPFWFYPSDESLDAEVNGELIEQVLEPADAARVIQRMNEQGIDAYGTEVQEALRARGHDGIVMVYPFGDPVIKGATGAAVLIAFDADQVKSATENVGAFSRREADIRLSVPAQVQRQAPERLPAAVMASAESPAFRDWFEDSVVVDAEGWPLPVFHGTTRSFARFSTARLGEKTGALDAKTGFFFAENPDAADQFTWEAGEPYGGNLMPVYLRLTNPMVVRDLVLDGSSGTRAGLLMRRAQAAGHDGVIFEQSNMLGRKGRTFAVFSPEQVKSVLGNRGSWSRRNADIRLSVPAEASSAAPSFHDWFAGSVVADAGAPQTVFHGTSHPDPITRFEGRAYAGWFTSDVQKAQVYTNGDEDGGGAIYPAYLAIRRPLDLSIHFDSDEELDAVVLARVLGVSAEEVQNLADECSISEAYWGLIHTPEFEEWVVSLGYDGIKARETGVITWAAVRPEQIKSAIADAPCQPAPDLGVRLSVPETANGRRPVWWQPPRDAEFQAWFEASAVRRPVFHATSTVDFKQFNTALGDLGSHFGTLGQALHISRERMSVEDDGARIIPVWLQLKNPLRLKDEGSFHADGIAVQLERKGLLPKGEGERIKRACDKDWQLRKQHDASLREVIKAAGYDGIVYSNKHEGAGDSYIVFDPQQVRTAVNAWRPRPQVLAVHTYPEEGVQHPVRSVARALKTGDAQALEAAAREMARMLPAGATLVPVPSSRGEAAATLELANRIAALTGARVADVLTSAPRPSQYEAKKKGQPLRAEDMGVRLRDGAILPAHAVLVDNVAGTGETLRAARAALGIEAAGLVYAAVPGLELKHDVRLAPPMAPSRPAPGASGHPDDPFDFASDPAFHHLFYGRPTDKEVAEFARWLRAQPDAFVRLYHGTAARNPVLDQGLLPASTRRRNSFQSANGFVCASVYPVHAQQFGVMAALNGGADASGYRVAVYPVVTTIRRLCADLDQLRNMRAGGLDCGNSLAESLVHGHGARMRGRIEPHALRAPRMYRTCRSDEDGEQLQARERERRAA